MSEVRSPMLVGYKQLQECFFFGHLTSDPGLQTFDFRLSNFFLTFTLYKHKTMSQPILSLKNVTVYQDSNAVLTHIDLEVNHGEFLYIIGKTGSGKSSLMKTMYADLKLKEGEGEFVGYNLRTLRERDIPYLRRKIGIVFQDFKLLPDRNVHDNLQFVLKATGWKEKREMDVKINEVLDKVGMKHASNKMPHQISGGEQQRIGVARALLNDPEVILADEPTGNLDPQTSVEVMNLLREINQNGKTIIMATHDYALIMKFPAKTLKCDEGTLFEVVQRTV